MNLIREIRESRSMSQQEFSEQLRVSFATVNRWENDKATPNSLAEDKIFQFCMEQNVPVLDMISREITKNVNDIQKNTGRTILYHGSKSGIIGSIAPKSRNFCDFGAGFYMGTELLQPLTLICGFKQAKLYVVSIDTSTLKMKEVPTGIEWAMLVAFHRGKMDRIKGTSLYKKYEKMVKQIDLVIGNIANDRMFYVIDNFFQGNITDTALVQSLSALKSGKQYVAITEKACSKIHIEQEIYLSGIERQYLQKMSEENREKGISLANETCKAYRRDGKFFDEILDAATESGGIL